MIKKSILAFIAVLFLGVTLPVLAAVTFDDVTHKWQLGSAHPTSSVSSGDVFAVSPDHARRFRVCKMELDDSKVKVTQDDYVVRNFLALNLPVLLSVLPESFRQAHGMLELFDGSPVTFSLSFTELETTALLHVPPECEAQITNLVNQRYKICAVIKSLVPITGVTNFSGYSFYPIPIIVPPTRAGESRLELRV